MKLHTLPSITTKSNKRLGRGIGSGVGGHTVGRGTKGQRSRVGRGMPLWFEGGQLPLIKRLPFMRGKSRFGSLKVKPQLVSLKLVAALSETEITPEVLKQHGYVKDVAQRVKIVGAEDVKRAMTITRIEVSTSAADRIKKAGGKVD